MFQQLNASKVPTFWWVPLLLVYVDDLTFFHSSGICSTSQTVFSISCIMSTQLSLWCLIRSISGPEHPAAFPFFILSMAFFTSSLDISWNGPSTAGTSPSCSLAFFTFSRLLKYSLRLSLIYTSSVSIFPVWSLTTFTSLPQCLFLILPFVLPLCRSTPHLPLFHLVIPIFVCLVFSFGHSSFSLSLHVLISLLQFVSTLFPPLLFISD